MLRVHRYYDPQTGQFISVDPLVDQTEQAYVYTSGDPVNASDPSGTSPIFGGDFGLLGAGDEGFDFWLGRDLGTDVGNDVRISALGHGRGFSSYGAFKRFFGSAGDGYEWHHIVEQGGSNSGKFSQSELQNTSNIVRVTDSTHRKISGYYSSIQPFSGGQTVRKWLAGRSFAFQYKFGLRELKRFGGGH